jgi:hypothetical protein
MTRQAPPSRGGQRKAADKPRSRWRFRPAYLFLVAVMGLFAYAYLQKTQEINRLSAEQAALAAQNRQLAHDNAQTERANRYFATKQYEIAAARNLGYSAAGETSVEITTVKPHAVVRAAPHPIVVSVPVKPVWQQWWDAFFD